MFFLYPSKQAKAGAHLLLWMLVYVSLLVICRTVFDTGDIFTAPVLIYAGVITFIVSCNHYLLSYFTLPGIRNGMQTWLILLQLFMVYIYSTFLSLYTITLMANSFPEYHMLQLINKRYSLHQPEDFFTYRTFSWFLSYVLFFNTFTFLLKFSRKYYEANTDKISLIEEKNQMELNFLRMQIQPHFLFNTLNNIYGLVIDVPEASESIIKLSDLLRFSLYESSFGSISLQREVSFLSDYISLEQMRHKDEQVNINFDFENENSALKIKPLLLVFFVENAFKHGVNANINYRWVNIVLKSSKNVVTFTITNNKSQNLSPVKNEEGVGLKNVRRRLELEYPERYDLSIKETQEIFEVKLTLKIDE